MSVLFQRVSRFQEITLSREPDGSLALALDGVWQFSSRDEARFHEVLADPAMVTAPRLRRVAILGGGDGLALRHVLRYDVGSVDLCELDGDVVEMARTIPAMRELNEASFEDPRVEVHVEDAREWIERVVSSDERYDVVICDFPAPTDASLAQLHDRAFFASLAGILHPDAVVSTQVSAEPPEFWPVLHALAAELPHVEPRLIDLADGLWADVILASGHPLVLRRPPAAEAEVLDPARWGRLVIRNRDGAVFLTEAFGTEPDFSE
jgi:spermidine synthase